ncbi:MAG: mechanosensitive ion channel family protein [Gammaproteobacteria bacterium]|nr:mechanosensitive ion channel family protein [Gammaproteobacteria bacterium]
MSINDLFSNIEFLGSDSIWVTQIFAVIFITLLIDFIQKRVLKRLHKRLLKTATLWDEALIEAIRKPLSLLIWVVGITLAADITGQNSEAAIFDIVSTIRAIGVIFAIIWFALRLVNCTQKNLIASRKNSAKPIDHTTADAISKLLKISIIITGLLITLQTLGFSISGLLAFGGVGGIAIGFAAKDLLANFFGGVMIYLDRPFTVGDWIRSPDREIEGTVEEIGWRLTRIRTFDKRPLYIPNSVFSTVSVENPSRMTNRRIKETIGIRYADANKMNSIISAVKEMLKNHPEIDQKQTLIVNFNSFAPSSLDFFIYTFTRTTDWIKFHEIKQDVLLKICDIIESHGGEIAFPTTTIHLPASVDLPKNEQGADS